MTDNHNSAQPAKYNILARQFHWIIAAFLVVMFALGWTMSDLPLSKLKLDLYAWHKWLGIIVLALALLRLTWRLISKAPAPAITPSVPAHMNKAAKLGHLVLYLLLLAVPLVGWLRSSTAGYPVVLFEKIPLPDLLEKNEALSKQLSQMHELLATVLLVVIIGHIAAVILHHMRYNDPVLQRMKPAIWHKALLVIALLAGATIFINSTILNPPAKMEQPAKQSAIEKPENISTPPQPAASKSKTDIKDQVWKIDKSLSKIEFVATQKSAPTTGEFKNYELKKLTFDPQNPSEAEVEIEIDTSSISLSNTLVEQTLKSSSWFDVADYPRAVFKAQNFEKLAGDNYKLNGELTIKNITRALQVSLAIETRNETSTNPHSIKAAGNATISRLNYQIGQGEWASTETLNDEVVLKINITAITNPQ